MSIETDVQQEAIARSLLRQNRAEEAEKILREQVRRHPRCEDAAMSLAEVLRDQGRLGAASRVVLALCDVNGFPADLCLRCAHFARQCDHHAVAARICEQALARNAKPPADLLLMAANVARESSDFEMARVHYRAALDAGINLEGNYVLGALANTRRYTDPADPDIARCQRHFRDTAYSTRSRASGGFGLAKILDDLGDFVSAATVLREANAMLHAAHPWDDTAWLSFVEARKRDRITGTRGTATPDFAPVFIVGMPRTGTTLTARLLARASGALDRGELRALRFIGERLSAGGHPFDTGKLDDAARFYHAMSRQDDKAAIGYLDQDPLNFRWLHIAAAMFPQARVIHLRRDRRDTALSLWSQEFAHPDMAFSYDFGAMAQYMDGYDSLMTHWIRTLHVPIHALDYEKLVGDTDAELAKLCDFIGARPLNPVKQVRTAPVTSASVWQARQPVYPTSVGRWRHYAPFVPELEQFG